MKLITLKSQWWCLIFVTFQILNKEDISLHKNRDSIREVESKIIIINYLKRHKLFFTPIESIILIIIEMKIKGCREKPRLLQKTA